jgi:hypothetical protein
VLLPTATAWRSGRGHRGRNVIAATPALQERESWPVSVGACLRPIDTVMTAFLEPERLREPRSPESSARSTRTPRTLGDVIDARPPDRRGSPQIVAIPPGSPRFTADRRDPA